MSAPPPYYGGAPPAGGPYGAPPAGPYGAPPTGPYGAPPAGPYGAPAPAYGAPPPGPYGAGPYGAPPAGPYGAPPRPAAPAAYGGAPAYGAPPSNPAAWALFAAVDTDRSGSITSRELQVALSNGGWTKFSPRTTKLLIKMFDADRSAGTLGYAEFERLLATLEQWRAMFERADTDRSGRLSAAEVKNCVRTVGFNLSDAIINSIYHVYDEDGSGSLGYDEFIQLIAELSALTAHFRRYDPSSVGQATLSFSSFIELVFSARA